MFGVIGILSAFMGPMVIVFAILIALILFLSYRLDIGLYIMVILTPMVGWQFHAESFRAWLSAYPQLISFYAPMVDIWAVLLLIAYGVYLVREVTHGRRHTIYMPGARWYGLFVLAGIISVMFLPASDMVIGLKYLIRFPIFVYLAFVVLGTNIIREHSIMDRVLRIYAYVGLGAAIMGFVSLFLGIQQVEGLFRAVPFGIGGWDPLNYGDTRYGHILLAEVLTVAIPVMMYLAYRARTSYELAKFGSMSIFTAVVCLLTFSRAGWLTLAFQVVVFGYLFRHAIPWHRAKRYFLPVGIVLAPFVVYMLWFLQSGTVSSSNSARVMLADIGWHMFVENPVTGAGMGMFTERLAEIHLFAYEFGDAIDQHSIVIKILSETGIIGFVTFVLFIFWVLSIIYRRLKDYDYSLEARAGAFLSFFLIASALFFQLFNTQYYSARMWVPIMLAISMSIYYRYEKKHASALFFQSHKHKVDMEIG